MRAKRSVLLTAAMVMVCTILFSMLPVSAEQGVALKKLKSVNMKTSLERLSKEEFQARFGNNPDIPRSNQAVISLAKKLYSKAGREEIKEECGESAYGVLYAALSNPEITDATIDAVGELADADMTSLTSIYTSGHFRIFYTSTDPDADQNVTLDDIKATATVLNDAWNDYVANFKEPLCYLAGGVKLIDVYVYYLGAGLYGATGSQLNYIELNSKDVVKNACRRQTTPVHELFHRVEYSYGYVTGTPNMSWATEGCAAWSQKYRAGNVGDWISRMNQGLNAPNLDLIASRSYDACHFWCYLGQQGPGGVAGGVEMTFIRNVWSFYAVNGRNMKNAVDTTIKSIIGPGYSFDTVAAWWMFANFYKDFTNASAGFDYAEDEWTRNCGGINYGPLNHAPRTTLPLNVGTYYNISGAVASYGANYYVFNVDGNVNWVQLIASGSGNFGFAVIEIKNGVVTSYQRDPAGYKNSLAYMKTFTAGQITQIALLVMGNPSGGGYSFTALSTKVQ